MASYYTLPGDMPAASDLGLHSLLKRVCQNLLTYLSEDVFAWRFILNENAFFGLTIYFQEPFFVFICFCSLFSNADCKINFTAKNGSDLYNFYSKLVLENKSIIYYFLLFFTNFQLLMFHNNYIVKSSETLNPWNLLKPCIKITYPSIFASFADILL